MGPTTGSYDLLAAASQLNQAGRHLIPALRALPAPLRATYAKLASDLADTAEQRRVGLPGRGTRRTIDTLIAGCDRTIAIGVGSPEAMAQTRALRDQLAELKEHLERLEDQLHARWAYSPAPRR